MVGEIRGKNTDLSIAFPPERYALVGLRADEFSSAAVGDAGSAVRAQHKLLWACANMGVISLRQQAQRRTVSIILTGVHFRLYLS